MKQLILFAAIFMAYTTGLAQGGSRDCPPCNIYGCCPNVLEVTITGGNLDSLHADSLAILMPNPGKAYRLTNPPIMRVYHDGMALGYASGEQIQIINDMGGPGGFGDGLMASWGDPCVTPYQGASQGTFWHNCLLLSNGQYVPALGGTTDGTIYVWSTYPITGGGANARIVITIWYEEISYP